MITELYTSPNMEFTEIITEPIINGMSTNSQSVAGLGEMQNIAVEISQQNLRDQSSANIQKFRITTVNLDTINQLKNILTITSKTMNLDMLAQFAIDFGLKKI